MMHSSLGLLVSGHAQQGLSFLPSGPTGPSLGGVHGVSLAASILRNSTNTLWNQCQMVESQILGNYPVLGINDCKQPNFEMHLRWPWWHGQIQYNWCYSSIIDLHHDTMTTKWQMHMTEKRQIHMGKKWQMHVTRKGEEPPLQAVQPLLGLGRDLDL